MPVAFRLYLPEAWAGDKERRNKAGVPDEVAFQTKPQIALDQIESARQRGVPTGVVLADAGYDNDTKFREQLTDWRISYVAGIQNGVTVWKPGERPKPAPQGKGMGLPPKLLQRDPKHQPEVVKDLALSLPEGAWKNILVEAGSQEETGVALCRPACAPGASRLLAGRSPSGRMAFD